MSQRFIRHIKSIIKTSDRCTHKTPFRTGLIDMNGKPMPNKIYCHGRVRPFIEKYVDESTSMLKKKGITIRRSRPRYTIRVDPDDKAHLKDYTERMQVLYKGLKMCDPSKFLKKEYTLLARTPSRKLTVACNMFANQEKRFVGSIYRNLKKNKSKQTKMSR